MVDRGAKGILITPGDSKADRAGDQEGARRGRDRDRARHADRAESAANALFATDNFKAGELIGKYAKAKATKGKHGEDRDARPAAGLSVGALRHNGFLKGFGIKEQRRRRSSATANAEGQTRPRPDGDGELPAEEPGHQRRLHDQRADRGRRVTALKDAGKAKGDDHRLGRRRLRRRSRNVKAGVIDATSQQYPLKMASLGVAGGRRLAKAGKKPSGYTDTGVNLITDEAVEGRAPPRTRLRPENCWG